MPHFTFAVSRSARRRRNTAAGSTSVPGYELLSVLGHGRHCTVYLATPVDTPQPLLDRVVARVYPRGSEAAARAVQMAYLWQELDSPHCPQFLDVPGHGEGDTPAAIVVSWARCGSLRELLDRRHSGLRPGEAVTVLAPVAQLLAELHRRARAHGGICAEAIHFDQAGRPILLGWGGASSDSAPTLDVMAFAELCEVVFAACEGSEWRAIRARSPQNDVRGSDFARLLASDNLPGRAAGDDEEEAAELAAYWANIEDALFALAEPCPIEPLQPFDWGAQTTTVLAEIDAEIETRVAEHRLAERRLARVRTGAVRALSGARIAAARIARERTIRLVPGGQRTVSVKTVVIGVLVCGIALAGALLATPPASVTAAQASTGTAAGGSRLPAETGVPDGAANGGEPMTPAVEPSEGQGVPVVSSVSAGPTTATPSDEAAIEGEDGVAALTALLRRRDSCFRQISAGCFDDVDQPQSTALASDQAAFAEAKRTGAAVWPRYVIGSGSSPPPTQRVGDAVMVPVTSSTGADPSTRASGAPDASTAVGGTIVGSTTVGSTTVAGAAPAGSTTKPASALLVKGETGWRIRQLFTQPD